ncbi:unnamed protein product, partial [marine sediment metagenome]
AIHITTAAVDETCAQPWVMPGGASVLIPIPSAIDTLATDLFAPPPTAAATR